MQDNDGRMVDDDTRVAPLVIPDVPSNLSNFTDLPLAKVLATIGTAREVKGTVSKDILVIPPNDEDRDEYRHLARLEKIVKESEVEQFDAIYRNALKRDRADLASKGFFLHDRVPTVEAMASVRKNLVPELFRKIKSQKRKKKQHKVPERYENVTGYVQRRLEEDLKWWNLYWFTTWKEFLGNAASYIDQCKGYGPIKEHWNDKALDGLPSKQVTSTIKRNMLFEMSSESLNNRIELPLIHPAEIHQETIKLFTLIWGEMIMVRKDSMNIFSAVCLNGLQTGPAKITLAETKERMQASHPMLHVRITYSPHFEYFQQLLSSLKFYWTCHSQATQEKRWSLKKAPLSRYKAYMKRLFDAKIATPAEWKLQSEQELRKKVEDVTRRALIDNVFESEKLSQLNLLCDGEKLFDQIDFHERNLEKAAGMKYGELATKAKTLHDAGWLSKETFDTIEARDKSECAVERRSELYSDDQEKANALSKKYPGSIERSKQFMKEDMKGSWIPAVGEMDIDQLFKRPLRVDFK